MLRFFFGLFCGICVGMVIAPARGEETRHQLRAKAGEWRGQQIEKGRREAREIGSEVAERLYDRAVGEE